MPLALKHVIMAVLLLDKVNGFRSYVDLYVKDKLDETGVALKVVNETVNERWEVCLTLSEKGFQQISFVNSIATTKVGETGPGEREGHTHSSARARVCVCVPGWQTHRLRGRPDCGQTDRSGEEEEQGGRDC